MGNPKGFILFCFLLSLILMPFPCSGAVEDGDGDGMPDWWEARYLPRSQDSALQDPDADGLSNLDEYKYGTHPMEKDTDSDGLDDGYEVTQSRTCPLMSDTDCGGRSDGDEVDNGQDPNSPDDDNIGPTTFTFHFAAGWNLFSFPLMPEDDSIDRLFYPIRDRYNVVWRCRDGVWNAFHPGNPIFTDFTQISMRDGYWIDMKESADLTVAGISRSITIPLLAGMNLVGFPSMIPMYVPDAIHTIQTHVKSVWGYRDGTWQSYQTGSGLNDLEQMMPGFGYWINVDRGCEWQLK